MIANELEQQIKNAADIEQIIGNYVALKRTGVNLKACCPFHTEDTASFVVSPAKGIFKCFGCGVGGDAIYFVQLKEGISYPEALKMVGKICHIEVPDRALSAEELAAYQQREQALNALEKQQKIFRDALKQHPEALQWLTNERGITPETISKWKLGYAENGFFGGRITYPFQNVKGEIVGFTGRRLKEENEPKFKNSAESGLFKKSALLYGLYQAKMKIYAAKKCYIVEGQHDVLMMHQSGFENTVASGGTALTVEQIRLIKSWTTNIVIVLDADKAGTNAVLKHIPALLAEQVKLRIVVLPEKEDPDSFLRRWGKDIQPHDEATETAQKYIGQNEIDFIEFKARIYQKEIDSDPVKKGEYLTEMTNDISLVHNKNIRLAYTQKCAKIFGIREGELSRDIARMREKIKAKPEGGTWFAFEEAAESIRELKEANILTNYDDVIDYHLEDSKNYIGMNCALLQKSEILRLKKLTRTAIFNEFIKEIYDTDAKEETATVLNLKRLISFGIDVRMRVERHYKLKRKGEDESDDQYDEYTEISYINFTDWYINNITALLTPADDLYTGWAIEHIAELLSFLPEAQRMVKIGNVQAEFKNAKVKLIIGDFKKILEKFLKKNAKSFEPVSDPADTADNPMNLSQEQLNDLNKYQHYFEKNSIMHVSKTGHIARVSNFTITPIIHSNASSGHFKLFEMNNEYGLKVNISLDTKDLNDLRRFKCAVEEKGNFVFKGDQFMLDNIKERLYCNTTYSDEIEQLGWQIEGFWAWGDGVTTPDGIFQKTDENGLIEVKGKNYLIKPFSNLYAGDKTAYINEKKFLHLSSDITFKDWSSRYRNVFGDNAMILTCMLLTTFYSDAIFKLIHGELPMINLFGPKGTGKTFQADSLLAFFGEKQPVNNLQKVTIYGLSQTLKSFKNSICILDEYKNSLEMKWIEMLKSIYNRQGKIQGNWASAGTKTETIPINQTAILCGQDLPTLDVALLERCICLTAHKNEYTDAEIARFNELKELEEKGFAHLTDDFIKYREYVIEEFGKANVLIQQRISQKCSDVSVRLQKNLSTILTTFAILESKFEFPFTLDQVLNFGTAVIRDQQKFIESSDDLKNFWSIFMTLIEQDKLKEGRNYVLHNVAQMRYVGSSELITYHGGADILYLRWEGLYPLYAEYSRRSNMVALGEKTIQFYLEKTKYFQGKIKAKRFKDKDTKQMWISQAFCFDYNLMNINLIESASIEFDNPDIKPNMDNGDIQEAYEKEMDQKEFQEAQHHLPF